MRSVRMIALSLLVIGLATSALTPSREDPIMGEGLNYNSCPGDNFKGVNCIVSRQGVYVTVKLPFYSAIFFVKKSDGGLRPCFDKPSWNFITVKYCYLVLSAEQLTAKLTGARVFFKLDLRNTYSHFQIPEGHEWKTGVRTQFRL